jgi:hypothetical protein
MVDKMIFDGLLARARAHGAVQGHAGPYGFDSAGVVVDDALEMCFKLAIFTCRSLRSRYKNRYSQIRSWINI